MRPPPAISSPHCCRYASRSSVPNTRTAWPSGASLAYWTGQAGDAAAARDEFAALVPVCERVLGPEYPNTLILRHNLADFAGYAGDAAAARDQFAALLPARERASVRITLTL